MVKQKNYNGSLLYQQKNKPNIKRSPNWVVLNASFINDDANQSNDLEIYIAQIVDQEWKEDSNWRSLKVVFSNVSTQRQMKQCREQDLEARETTWQKAPNTNIWILEQQSQKVLVLENQGSRIVVTLDRGSGPVT